MSKKKDDSYKKNLRKLKKRQINRETIIKYAEKEFIDKGYSTAKIDDIAFNSGNAKATVYNYFESKDDLLIAVLSKIYQLFLEILSNELISAGSTKDLRTIIQAYIKFTNLHPAHSDLLLSPESLIINKNVYEKIANGQKLSESEDEYRNLEAELGNLINEVFVKYFKNTPTDSDFYIRMRRIFINFVFMIREIIIVGKLLKRSENETEEDLAIVIRIIEQGIKNFQ